MIPAPTRISIPSIVENPSIREWWRIGRVLFPERELPVATYEYFAARDPLQRAVMDRMLAGVSTRNGSF